MIDGLLLVLYFCATIKYDRRRPGIPSASLDTEYSNNRTERIAMLIISEYQSSSRT